MKKTIIIIAVIVVAYLCLWYLSIRESQKIQNTPEQKSQEIIPLLEPEPIGPYTEIFTEPTELEEDFCGESTRGTCLVDSDCTDEICSGLCQSIDEELATAGCVTRECHNTETYSMQCKCVNEQCQWYKYPRE